MTLLNPFIKLWIGEEYVLEEITVFAIVLHFYINGIQFAGYTYRTTAGLFVKGRIAPIIAAIINVVLSIVLGYYLGITGIIFATSIARLVTTTWLDPFLVHKYEFKTSISKFIKKYFYYTIVVIVNAGICQYFIASIGDGLINFILKAIIITIVSNIFFLLVFLKKEEFKNILYRIKNILKGDRKCY